MPLIQNSLFRCPFSNFLRHAFSLYSADIWSVHSISTTVSIIGLYINVYYKIKTEIYNSRIKNFSVQAGVSPRVGAAIRVFRRRSIWTKFGPLRRSRPQLVTTSGNSKAMVVPYSKWRRLLWWVVVDCLRGTHNPSVPGSNPGGPTN